MEIVTIPFTGALQHKDNAGGEGVIKAGDVQIMSAGSGIQHSESNASKTDPVTLFQIWVFPKERNIKPRYDQRNFDEAGRKDQWQTLVSPVEADNALWINQDAKFSLTTLSAGKDLSYTNGFKGNGVFLVVIKGKVEVEGNSLGDRDAIAISETDSFSLKATADSEILAIEIPMK